MIDYKITGGSTIPTLRALLAPELRTVFARVSLAFETGDLYIDPADLATVERAHAMRVAVAIRWSTAGKSPLESRLAADVDRALDPHENALLATDASETDGDWLGRLWTDDAIDIDLRAWWGVSLRLDISVPHEIAEATLAAIATDQYTAPPSRHESTWEDCYPDPWREERGEREEHEHATLEWLEAGRTDLGDMAFTY